MHACAWLVGFDKDELAATPPVVEQKRAVTRALDPFEKLLGNDLVGVDIRAVERSNDAGDAGEGFHQFLENSLTSTRWPAIAAAAAIGGLDRGGPSPPPSHPPK